MTIEQRLRDFYDYEVTDNQILAESSRTEPFVPQTITRGDSLPEFRAYQLNKGRHIEIILKSLSNLNRQRANMRNRPALSGVVAHLVKLHNETVQDYYRFLTRNRTTSQSNSTIRTDAQRDYTRRQFKREY